MARYVLPDFERRYMLPPDFDPAGFEQGYDPTAYGEFGPSIEPDPYSATLPPMLEPGLLTQDNPPTRGLQLPDFGAPIRDLANALDITSPAGGIGTAALRGLQELARGTQPTERGKGMQEAGYEYDIPGLRGLANIGEKTIGRQDAETLANRWYNGTPVEKVLDIGGQAIPTGAMPFARAALPGGVMGGALEVAGELAGGTAVGPTRAALDVAGRGALAFQEGIEAAADSNVGRTVGGATLRGWTDVMQPRSGERLAQQAARTWAGQQAVDAMRQSQVMTPAQAANIIGSDRPEHLAGVMEFMLEQRAKTLAGQVKPSDIAKAHLMTVGSQLAGPINIDLVRPFVGDVPEWAQVLGAKGARQVRPEDAIGLWLASPEGRTAFRALDAGTYDPALWQGVLGLRARYGNPQGTIRAVENIKGGIARATEWADELNAATDKGAALDAISRDLIGVGAGKEGFWQHFLGFGNKATSDAIERNFWITGRADARTLDDAAKRLNDTIGDVTKNYKGASAVQQVVQERLEALRAITPGMADVPDEIANHIMHHWLWDAANDSATTHRPMYDAMRAAMAVPADRDAARAARGLGDVPVNPLSEMGDDAARAADDFIVNPGASSVDPSALKHPARMTLDEFKAAPDLPTAPTKDGYVVLYHRLRNEEDLDLLLREGIDPKRAASGVTGADQPGVFWTTNDPKGFSDLGTVIALQVPESSARSAGVGQFIIYDRVPAEDIIGVDIQAPKSPTVSPGRRLSSIRNNKYADRYWEDYQKAAPTPPRTQPSSVLDDLLPDMGGGATVNAIGTRLDQVTPRPLTVGDRVANTFRSVLRQGKVDEIATPIFLERADGARRIDNLAATFGEQTKAITAAFTRDKYGRIPDLATPAFPKGPTIQDVAARLPEFDGMLTPKQQGAMNWLRSTVSDFRAQWDEVQDAAGTLANRQAKELNTRGDIVEGGFYLPRGRADLEGADLPVKVPSGRSAGAGSGAGGGYKAPAKFDSMAEGIDKGYEYADIADAIRSHVKAIGTDINNRATANKMLELVDDNGIRVAQTAADRVDPTLRRSVQQVTGQIAQRRVTALRQNLLANAAGKNAEQAKRITESANRLADNAEKRLWALIANGSTDEVIHAAERELLVLRREAAKQARRANLTETNAALRGAKYLETSEAIDDLSVQLFDLRGKYKHAQDIAKSRPRDYGSIGLPELQGWEFPDVIANAANRELQKEIPLQGKGAGTLKAVNAINSLSRAFKSTGDNSAMGVQGLLGLGADQKAYAQAVKANAKAWFDPKAQGEFMVWFDDRAAKEGLPAVADWARTPLHIGGSSTEFSFNRGLTQAVQDKIKRIPKVGGAFDTVDRAFGTFGDTLRLEWAQNELKTLLARNPGKSWQELPEEMDKIAKAMNRQTGYSPARFGQGLGDIGDLVLFAPRFLQARLETVVHALTPTNDLENRLARNALLSTVGYATLLTAGVNSLTGGVDGKGGTDWRPTIRGNDGKTKANPNFMKVRFNDKDWSLLGSYDSLARMFIQIGAAADPTSTASPLERLRTVPDIMLSLGSSTTRDAALAIEMFNKATANGKPVASLKPEDYAAWLGGHFNPISSGAVLEAGVGTIEAAKQGDVGKTLAGAVTGAAQFLGGKASDLAYSDIRDQVAFRMFQKPFADLDREQEKAVRGDDAVAKRDAEFLPTPQSDQQYLEPLFNAATNKKANLEADLATKLAAGLKGEGARKAIQEFKQLSYEAGDTVFGSPEAKEALARATVNKSVDIKDQLRDQYWNAPMPEQVVNGELVLDHKAQDAVRQQVLERAAAVGAPADYITKRDYSKYKDPLVRERVKAYDEAQETLRSYWELKDKILEAMPAVKQMQAAIEQLDADNSPQAEIAKRTISGSETMKLYRKVIDKAQEATRLGYPDIDKALVEWGYSATPIGVQIALRNR